MQLYIRDGASVNAPANSILCGFQRVALEAGESKTVKEAVDPAALTVVTDAGERIPGSSWMLYAGVDQPDARTEELTGKMAL